MDLIDYAERGYLWRGESPERFRLDVAWNSVEKLVARLERHGFYDVRVYDPDLLGNIHRGQLWQVYPVTFRVDDRELVDRLNELIGKKSRNIVDVFKERVPVDDLHLDADDDEEAVGN